MVLWNDLGVPEACLRDTLEVALKVPLKIGVVYIHSIVPTFCDSRWKHIILTNSISVSVVLLEHDSGTT